MYIFPYLFSKSKKSFCFWPGILNQFDLLDVYADDFKNAENSVLDKEDETLFAKVLKKDKKLAKLWKKAELSAFSGQTWILMVWISVFEI